MSFQPSEVVCLIIALAFALPAAVLTRGLSFAGARWFVLAVFFGLGASVCTVAEGALLPRLLNVLEHLAYAGAAISLATGARRLDRELRGAAAP